MYAKIMFRNNFFIYLMSVQNTKRYFRKSNMFDVFDQKKGLEAGKGPFFNIF